jgi:hypothetical protein
LDNGLPGNNSVEGYPHPRVFLRKSAESAENKRVEFCRSAKRVRKNIKRNEIDLKRVAISRM